MDSSVIVSDQSVASADPSDIVYANVEFVNALFGEHLRADEIAPDALRSYYVDYYLTQVNNGGFSQFVYNSRWSPLMIGFIREGLLAMKAVGQLALFNESAALVERLGADGLQAFSRARCSAPTLHVTLSTSTTRASTSCVRPRT